MKREKNRFYIFETLLYVSILLISLFVHVILHYDEERKWLSLSLESVRLAPFVLVFLINNYLLVSKLLFKKKYTTYIVSCICMVIIVLFLNDLWMKSDFSPTPPKHHQEMMCQPIPPHHEMEFHAVKPTPPPGFHFDQFIFCLLLIGFNSGIKFFIRWKIEDEEKEEKERQYLDAELAFLRHQISPHFFMNTLNNIHALVDIDPEKSKDTIVKLSQLMRYLLYETEVEKVPLHKEIEFLNSYIELMLLRYDENKLSIQVSIPENTQTVSVPSLLFLPLVENAFKHGVSIKEKSFIDISFSIESDKLTCNIKNSRDVMNRVSTKTTPIARDSSGIGLENIKKRLSLIYKDNYELYIHTIDAVFNVTLTIPTV